MTMARNIDRFLVVDAIARECDRLTGSFSMQKPQIDIDQPCNWKLWGVLLAAGSLKFTVR